jgi:hypothetical protein
MPNFNFLDALPSIGHRMGMTEQEQDTLIGKLVRQRKQASDEVALLRLKLADIGPLFEELGVALKNHPENVYEIRKEIDGRFIARNRLSIDPASWPSISAVMELVVNLRDALVKQEDAASKLAQLGILQEQKW